jgi:hypothetical protein
MEPEAACGEAKAPDRAGLCGRCRHARRVAQAHDRGYILCLRSAADPSFPKYPRLPTLSCDAYEDHRP